MAESYAHCTTPFTLCLSEAGYGGNFKVTFSKLTGPDGGLNFNGTVLPTDFTTSLAAGNYPMSFTSNAFLGNMCTRVVATDDYGQQTTYLIQQEITPLPITVTSQVVTGTVSTAPINDMFTKPSYADVTYTFSRKLPGTITVSHDFAYQMEYTRVSPSYLNKQASGTVTIPAGSTTYTQRIVYDEENEPQYHYVGGVETLLRRGYLITDDYTLTVGPITYPGGSVSFTLQR